MNKLYASLTLIINFSMVFSQTTIWEKDSLDGNNIPFYIGGFTQISTEFADIDGDNDYDCFVGTQDGNIAFFENIGDSITPIWKLITINYLDLELSTINRMKARFIDIDCDSDLDLFIGGALNPPLLYYKNIGDKYNPEWELVPGFLSNIESGATIKFCYPDFVDIDNDNDYDLIYGNYKGYDVFYENTGDKYTPVFELKNSDFFDLSGFWNVHNIEFSDIDLDNDFDCLIGITSRLLYMKNIGNQDSAIWKKDTMKY